MRMTAATNLFTSSIPLLVLVLMLMLMLVYFLVPCPPPLQCHTYHVQVLL